MRAFIFVILAAAAMADSEAEADADAYTIGQVYAGLPLANAYASGRAHNPGVITGVSYGGYGGLYGGYYGKREADSEPKADADADAYTIGQVAYGLPLANAYATGHAHNPGVITGVGYGGYGGYGLYGGYYGKREADSDSDAYTIGQVAHGAAYGVVTGVDYGNGLVSGYGAIGNRGYLGYGGLYGGYYGKREADSDPKADADAYTIGQVAHGAAYGVVTGVDYGHGLVSGYGAVGNRGYLGYGGLYGGYYGKREADSDPKADAYTIGQVYAGLPLHNAFATGHAHNPGVITNVGYSGYGFPYYG